MWDKEISPLTILIAQQKKATLGQAFHFGTAQSKPEISSYREPIPSWKLRPIASA